MDNLENNSVPSTVDEVDALLSSIESPESSVPEATEARVMPEAEQPTPKEAAPTSEQLHQLSRKGITKDFPISKVLQFAQQGWDYQERMGEFNQERTTFENERKAHQEALSRLETYQELEKYIQNDPQWWEHIRSAYQEKVGGNPNDLQKIVDQQVSKAVEPFAKFMEQQEVAKQDAVLDGEMQSFRESNPDFDWKTTDDSGRSILEQKILNHAVENRIGSFQAAARDFLWAEMASRTELKSREKVSQELKKQTKLGLGPVTNQPVTDIKRAKNVSSKSYDDIADEAMKEFGIG